MYKDIIHHEENAFKIKHRFRFSIFTNKLGEFNNEVLELYKKTHDIEHVVNTGDGYLYFCTLVPDAEEINTIEQ